MALRWFATQPIYFGTGAGSARAFTQGQWVPDEIVAANGLASSGYVTQVDVGTELPDIVSAPLTSATIRRIEVMTPDQYAALPSQVRNDPSRLFITI